MEQVRRVAIFIGETVRTPVLNGGSWNLWRVARRLRLAKLVSDCHSNVHGRWTGVFLLIRNDRYKVVGSFGDVWVLGSDSVCNEIESTTLSRADLYHFRWGANVTCN